MERREILDRACKTCGARPAEYETYDGERFRRSCVECCAEVKATHWQKRKDERAELPTQATLARACVTCGSNPAVYRRHASAADGYTRECVECKAKVEKAWRARNRNRFLEYLKRHGEKERSELKREAISRYGGACYCCGETDIRFLTLDHVNNDGAAHRREIGKASGINCYRWARRNDWPAIFQVACFNCNSGRHQNGGICPHQEQRENVLRLVS